MTRTALKVKSARKNRLAAIRRDKGLKVKFSTRLYNRCRLCGHNNGYMRRFAMCRICFRELAGNGKLMGVKKSSW